MFEGRVLRQYLAGLGCTFIGAWLMAETGSVIPLALGGSASLLCTLPLIKSIWNRAKRQGRSPKA